MLTNDGNDDTEGEKYEILRFDVHPGRNYEVVGVDDIGVITLKRNITFNQNAKPICLADNKVRIKNREEV